MPSSRAIVLHHWAESNRFETKLRLSIHVVWADLLAALLNDRSLFDRRALPMTASHAIEERYRAWFYDQAETWRMIWERAGATVDRVSIKISYEQALYDAWLDSRALVIGTELAAVNSETIGAVLANREIQSWTAMQYELKKTIGMHPRQYSAYVKQVAALKKKYPDTSPDKMERMAARLANQKMNYRAQLIARTEIMGAINESQLQSMKHMQDQGLTEGPIEKYWSTVGDNRVSAGCEANEAQGWIPLEDSYESGHEAPPRMPGCRCALQYRVQRERRAA